MESTNDTKRPSSNPRTKRPPRSRRAPNRPRKPPTKGSNAACKPTKVYRPVAQSIVARDTIVRDTIIDTTDTTDTANIVTNFSIVWADKYHRQALNKYMTKDRRREDINTIIADINQLVGQMISRPHTDVDVMNAIVTQQNRYAKSNARWRERTNERAKSIISLLSGRRVMSYLDYGCADCKITQQVSERLNIPYDQTYGMDIIEPPDTKIIYLQNSILSILDSSIDLVTVFVTFHHLTDVELEHCLGEIVRVMRLGGVLIIREHDFDGSAELQALLNLIHLYIDIAGGAATIQSPGSYRAATDWTAILNRWGFRLDDVMTYAGNNPQRLYYAIYVLEKKSEKKE